MKKMDVNVNEVRKRYPPTKNQPTIDDNNNNHNNNSNYSIEQIITTSFSSMAILTFNFIASFFIKTLAALLIILPVLLTFTFFYGKPNSILLHFHQSGPSLFAHARVLIPSNMSSASYGHRNVSAEHVDVADDKLLGGLLSSEFDEGSCLSRYQSSIYRKASPFKPSDYLLSKLRKYEELHKRCGPGTQPYHEALKQLKYDNETASPTECNYVVWISYSGLGNRILTISAAFLYALLSNRVLLVDTGADMPDLFCEPFPGSSWFLPQDFPLNKKLKSFHQKSPRCHGFMLKKNLLNASVEEQVPSYLYLHLDHDYNDQDKLFFCDEDQTLLGKVPWLFLKTDNYFVPSLYLIPSFEQELIRLFPRKVTIFHHLGRYLLHPTNQVWGLITRYYNAYLARADERIGIQIRTFEEESGPFPHVTDQILNCISKEKLLPNISKDDSFSSSTKIPRSISVLVTSLDAGYSDALQELYWEHPTVTGEVVGVFQPSHEGFQQSQKKMHDRKAWAEMYLLSLSDKLVTSAWSTFGYVAQGLGGLKPWILYKPEDKKTPEPACVRAMSIEPCFHAPPFWDCKAKTSIDTGKLVPHVRHCEDMSWGLKVVEGREEE